MYLKPTNMFVVYAYFNLGWWSMAWNELRTINLRYMTDSSTYNVIFLYPVLDINTIWNFF